MPQAISVMTYDFNELSESSKLTAIDNHRYELLQYDDWDDCILDSWKEKLELLGFNSPEINYSGWSCQGDGASFTAHVDLVKWMKANDCIELLVRARLTGDVDEIDYVNMSIYRDCHRYSHEMTVSISTETYHADFKDSGIEDAIVELEETILENARQYMKEIYKDLEKEMNHQTSDETLKEYFSESDRPFLENGKDFLH